MPVHDEMRWDVPVEVSAEEQKILGRCKRTGRLFAFLRRHRHELCPRPLERKLVALYNKSPLGRPPLPPAMLWMVTLLQAYQGLSDAAAVEEAVFDRRWQMVLGCLGAERPPFSQGALVDFRKRLVEAELHTELIAASVELAKQTGGFGFTQLRVALDSAPLWGVGRVEDTFNLIGHAMQIVLTCAARAAQCSVEALQQNAQLTLLGHSSLKRALDIDWDDPEEQRRAFKLLLDEAERLERYLHEHLKEHLETPALQQALHQLTRLIAQDTEPDPNGEGLRIKRGVAKERQISLSDPQMRHGRKSKTQTIKGFKRFVARELDHGLIVGVTIQPANRPERQACPTLQAQVEALAPVESLYIDRGFLSGEWTAKVHQEGKRVICRPWPSRNQGRFTKQDFHIDLDAREVTCPASHTVKLGKRSARFGARCDGCALREQCTRAKAGRGRTITVHPNEDLLQKLHRLKTTPEGRNELRKRVPVEHALAHICNRQGRRARYRGVQKNIFDLARYAVIENCFVADRIEKAAA